MRLITINRFAALDKSPRTLKFDLMAFTKKKKKNPQITYESTIQMNLLRLNSIEVAICY